MESIKYCAVSSSMCSMPGWLPRSVRLHFLHLNSLLYEKQSEFFSAQDEIVFGPLSPLNKTMILHFISDISSQCIIGLSVCKTYCKRSAAAASRTYKSESQMFAGKRRVIITRRPEWEMRRVIVPRGLRFWAVCLGSCYNSLFTANIQMSHKEESARAESLTLFASMVGSVSGSNLQIKRLQIN